MFDQLITHKINQLEEAANDCQLHIDELLKLCDDWRKLNEEIQK